METLERKSSLDADLDDELVRRLDALDLDDSDGQPPSLASCLVALARQAGSGLAVSDREGRFLLTSESFCALVGRGEEELRQLTIMDITHPDDRERSRELTTHLLSTGEGATIDKRYIRPDGTSFHARTMVTGVRGRSGRMEASLALIQDVSGEVEARTRQERRERRYRALVEATGGIVWAVQPDGRGATLSKDWERFTGQTAAESEDFGWFRQVHPEDRDMIRSVWEQAIASREPVSFQYRVLRRDGVYRRMAARGIPVLNDDGELVEVVGTSTDIEDVEQAEAARASSAAMVQALVANSPIGTALLDTEGRYLHVNRALAEMNGLPVEDHIGQKFTELFPAMARRHGPLLDQVLRTGEPLRDQVVSAGGDRDPRLRRHWLNNYYPVPGPRGEVAGVAVAAIEISERVRVQEALAESEARLRALLEATPAMVIWFDIEGVVQFVSQTWSEFTGLDLMETRRWEELDLIHPDDMKATETMRAQGIASGKGYDIDYRLKRTDGEYRWVTASLRPAVSPEGRVVGWTYVALDVHERVRARERLERLNADLRMLADSVPALVVTAPTGGLPSFANREWRKFTGVDLEDVDADWEQSGLVHPDDVAGLLASWQQTAANRVPSDLEFRLRRADGQYRWVAWRAHPLIDPTGNSLGWIAAGIDIEDQVRLREEVQRANEQLRVLAGAGDIMSGAAEFSTGAEAAARVLVPQMADWCSIDVLRGDEATRQVAIHSPTLDGREAARLKETTPHLDDPLDPLATVMLTGRQLFLPHRGAETADAVDDLRPVVTAPPGSLIAVPLRAGGRSFGVMTLVRALERPRFTEADYATALELGARFGTQLDRARLFSQVTRALGHLRLLADAGLVLSRAGELQEAIDQAARVVVPSYADWCTVDLLEGHRIRRAAVAFDHRVDSGAAEVLRHSEARLGDMKDFVARIIETGEPVFVRDVGQDTFLQARRGEQYKRAVEQLAPASLVAVPLRAGDRVFGALGLVRTGGRDAYSEGDQALALELGRQLGGWIERSRLFSELRQALSAKDEFFGFVSHELKTPLTTVVGLSDVLARRFDRLEEEQRAEAVALLRRDSLRLEEIIANMLTLARSERATGDEPILVQRIIDAEVSLHRQRHPNREVSIALEGSLPPVLAPGGWIDRVLENLLSNAEKYSVDDTSPIEVEATEGDAAVTVRVLDRGRGISEQQMRDVFEPFFRADPNEPGVPGVGLGLTVCRRLVERLGGQVWLRPREGGGIEAGFTIPSMDVPEE